MLTNKLFTPRQYDISVATPQGTYTHRISAPNTMTAYQWALDVHRSQDRQSAVVLHSLVVKPALSTGDESFEVIEEQTIRKKNANDAISQ